MVLEHPGVVKRRVAHVDGLTWLADIALAHAPDGDLAAAVARAEQVLAVDEGLDANSHLSALSPLGRRVRFALVGRRASGRRARGANWGAGSPFARLPYGRALRSAYDTCCEALDVCGRHFLAAHELALDRGPGRRAAVGERFGKHAGHRSNDNSVAGGHLEHGELHLALVARRGLWYPDGPGTIGLPIEAFGEAGGALLIPGPLVRVPVGTRIVARIRNELAHDLTSRGLARPSEALMTVLRVAQWQDTKGHFRSRSSGDVRLLRERHR